ncbi:MAG: HAD family phosphatase [Chthoniobacterales bacterium]
MEVEAFIFDIGNVLVRFEPGKAERTLAKLGVQHPDFAALAALGQRYEAGALDRAEFLASWREALGGGLSDDVLAKAWQEIFEPNEPMWELVEKLHGSYPLYLLSNTNCLHHEYLVREYPVFGKFTDGVFSYRVRMMKPEHGIFELAIRQFGVSPAATVYLDDLPANVEAAGGVGLRALVYRHDAHGELAPTLRAHGVQCV